MSDAPVICYYCEKVFMGGPRAFVCPECRKRIASQSAKKREAKRKEEKLKGAVKK